ncbi:MAG: sulfurtransferase complex subunit TusD [Gammaproteobacteria bacterium]
MRFAVQINASPYHSDAGDSAFRFVSAALAAGHEVLRVFFYFDGIYHALRFAVPPADETRITARWSALAKMHGIDLAVCVSAAQRRGLLTAEEARRQHKKDNDLAEGFRIAGLGQWVEATLLADRVIVFGGS